MRFPARLCAVAALAAVTLLVGACASVDTGSAAGPPAPAPDYRVGDRWVYHVVDGYRAKIVWDETHEITAIGAGRHHREGHREGIDVQCRSRSRSGPRPAWCCKDRSTRTRPTASIPPSFATSFRW